MKDEAGDARAPRDHSEDQEFHSRLMSHRSEKDEQSGRDEREARQRIDRLGEEPEM